MAGNRRFVLEDGTLLHGTYKINRHLASGGFGNTYVATNIEFDERIACNKYQH